jgi:hypothetical protein
MTGIGTELRNSKSSKQDVWEQITSEAYLPQNASVYAIRLAWIENQ